MRDSSTETHTTDSPLSRRGFLISTGIAAGGIGLTSLPAGASHLPVNPSPPPHGSIESPVFEWLGEGAPQTGNDCALRLSDEGGVDIGYHFEFTDALTIDFYWRHHEGGELAYMWNDLDSTSSGFRAFTNGVAGSGMNVRLPWATDMSPNVHIQDGEWHNIRLVVDGSDNTTTLYIDGDQIAQSGYDGSTFTTSDTFRAMGRPSGESTMIDYDRYVWAPEAIHPGEGDVSSDLLHYELDDCDGDIVENEPGDEVDDPVDCIDRRERGRGDEDIPECDDRREDGRGDGSTQPARRSRRRDDR